MITATMNAKEIERAYLSVSPKLRNFCNYRLDELRKWALRNRQKTVWRSLIHNAYGMKFLLVLKWCGYSQSCHFINVYCEETNEWIDDTPADKGMSAYSTHFLRRYAERILGDKDIPIEKAMMLFIKRNIAQVNVYADGNDTVYASDDGIALCKYDERRSLTIRKTFVSLDMLKETQSAAYDKIRHVLDKQKGIILDAWSRREAICSSEVSYYTNALDMLSIGEAQSIYSQFFDKNNKHK